MKEPIQSLLTVLQDDQRIFVNGQLMKNKIMELAIKNDEDLIKRLLSEEHLRSLFFVKAGEVYVFLRDKFVKFIGSKEFLPNSYTMFRNKIGLAVGDELLKDKNDVVLNFPYKDCVLEGGQDKEDAKRDEVFYNEMLAPVEVDRLLDEKVFINVRRYDQEGVHEDVEWAENDNLIIKGNNLMALHSIRKKFLGKVKLIYIDPPYNTEQDSFNYNDKFKHSTWLTFMKNRLEVARDMLADDGAIFIQISDKEQAYLKVLCDEIFGVDNFINMITVRTKSPSGFKTVNLGVFETAEYLLVYGKIKSLWKYNTQYEKTSYDKNYSKVIVNIDKPYTEWKIVSIKDIIFEQYGVKNQKEFENKYGKEVLDKKIADFALENANRVFRLTSINEDAGQTTLQVKEQSKKEPGKVFKVEREGMDDRYILDGQEISFYAKKVREIDGELTPTNLLTNIWTDISWEGIANEGNVKLKKGKKPEKLLKRIIEMSTKPGDLVMDFFLGSGTTAAVAHKLKRRYIGIEQLDYGENDSVIRLQNVINGDQTGISKLVNWKGGGSFVYVELMKWNQIFKDALDRAETKEEIKTIYADMKEKAFLDYRVKLEEFEQNMEDFMSLSLSEQKEILYDLLDKNQLYVNVSEIDDEIYQISEKDKAFNRSFYKLKAPASLQEEVIDHE